MAQLKSNKQTKLFKWLIVCLFLAAIISQARLHLVAGDRIIQYAEETNRFKIRRVDYAKRGTIYSSDGKVLAQSSNSFRLGISFARVPKSPGFFLDFATASQIPATLLEQAAYNGAKNLDWEKPLTGEVASAIQEVKAKWRADGISLHRANVREYPLAEAAAPLLGCIRDSVAVCGLEKSQNSLLDGVDGYREGLVDRTGAFLPMRESRQVLCKHGKSITLTINSHFQMAATKVISEIVEANLADYGSVIIYDHKTGDLLAMATWPSFNPSGPNVLGQRFSDFNTCVQARWEPASMFKTLTLAEGLNEGVVSMDTMIDCPSYLKVSRSATIHCDNHRAHGHINSSQGIAVSCNVAASTWMLRLGYKRMVSFLDRLQILEPVHIGLPGEVSGSFNRNEYAKAIQMANVSFGQSLTASPVATISAFGTLANHGLRMHPRLIKSIDGKPTAIRKARQVFRPEVADTVLRSMETTIDTDAGTGKALRIPGYKLAGKTGTAQKTNALTGGIKGGGHISSFLGMVPARDPKVTIMVIVDKPKMGLYHGASLAGPSFKELAKTVIGYYNIPPTEPITAKSTGQKSEH